MIKLLPKKSITALLTAAACTVGLSTVGISTMGTAQAHADDLNGQLLPLNELSHSTHPLHLVNKAGLASALAAATNGTVIAPAGCSQPLLSLALPKGDAVGEWTQDTGYGYDGEAILDQVLPNVNTIANIYTSRCAHLTITKPVTIKGQPKTLTGNISLYNLPLPRGLLVKDARLIHGVAHVNDAIGLLPLDVNVYIGLANVNDKTVALGSVAPIANALLPIEFPGKFVNAVNKAALTPLAPVPPPRVIPVPAPAPAAPPRG